MTAPPRNSLHEPFDGTLGALAEKALFIAFMCAGLVALVVVDTVRAVRRRVRAL